VGIVDRLHSPQIYATNDDHWQEVILAPRRMVNKGAFLVVRAQPGQLPSLMKRVPDALKAASTQRVIPQPHGVLRFTDLRQLAFRGDRGLAWMLGGISVVLLMVTAAGIVGLTSFWVGQRRRQIGIRRALGARRQDILCYFLTENGLIAAAGIAAGIVLTGGAARMEGALELAEEIFHKMVRIGVPQHISGLGDVVSSELHSTGVGLLLHGSRASGGNRQMNSAVGNVGNLVEKFRSWFSKNF
ncbi:hypothetical protein KCV01_g21743, partial [Aureobasidium melanogenum]